MEYLSLSKVISMLWICRTIAVAAASLSVAWPGCQEKCGEVVIPYPFGIGAGCYMNESFAVYCDNSYSPPKPYLSSIEMELLGVSMKGYVNVNNSVITSNCGSAAAVYASGVNLSGSPYIFSDTYSRFTATGCDNYAVLLQDGQTVGACLSMCSNGTTNYTTGCYGLDCCQTTIPPYIKSFETSMEQVISQNVTGCKSAFMVNQEWFDELKADNDNWFTVLRNQDHVPALLQWGTDQGYCCINEASDAFCSDDGYCWRRVGQSHLCVCISTYEEYTNDIPYITAGCPEGATCMSPGLYNCRLLCVFSTAPGQKGYNCSCDFSINSDNTCDVRMWYLYGKSNRAKTIIIACTSAVGSLLLLIGAWWLFKIIKRRKEIRLKQKFFKRNGGLLLQQQLCSTENNIEQTKIFTSKELEKATDNYHTDRIIGQGGQGTVYKGMLTDGRIVAIKKSKSLDEDQLAEFINEVVILSQINHRNVVKLLGCCLETEVPLLVYEFIPNGTLFQHLHDENEGFPMTWEIRLQIATEVANALSYLHSAAASPIYHRDIKSTNILLDEKYRAKVSDFGISRSIAIDQTHVTTRVQGTPGYLDPQYFQSSQFTEKSDVYSFGVVLVELLTGQKPVRNRSVEERSLATYFLRSMEDDHLFEILDSRVREEGRKEEIAAVAKLAKGCLNLNGAKRPTMTTVAMELAAIRASQGASSIITQECEEVDYTGMTAPWDAASSSTVSCFNITAPLLTNT